MVKIYCIEVNRDDFDKKLSSKDHECLDDLPRKSVGDQVKAFQLAGQSLEDSRRALFELRGINDDNVDVDEYDTGLDEYSDFHDYEMAKQDLYEKASNINASRKAQATNKKETTKEKPEVETSQPQSETN